MERFKLNAMIPRRIKQTLSAILFLWAGSAQADDADAIRQARLAQNEAIAAGDADRVASFWTDDVTLRRGLGGSTIGKEAYRAIFEAVPNRESHIFVRELEFIEVSSDWPLAFESGTWTARRGSADGPAVISGRYSAQWVKREGIWLIRSEVFVALKCCDEVCNWPALP